MYEDKRREGTCTWSPQIRIKTKGALTPCSVLFPQHIVVSHNGIMPYLTIHSFFFSLKTITNPIMCQTLCLVLGKMLTGVSHLCPKVLTDCRLRVVSCSTHLGLVQQNKRIIIITIIPTSRHLPTCT